MLARGSTTVGRIDMRLFLGLAMLPLAACDGGGEFAAAAGIVNNCDVPVTVTVGEAYARELTFPRPDQPEPIEPGAEFTLNNAILKPIPDRVFVYVASPADAAFTDPFPMDPAGLPVANGGRTDIYTIVISGEMCPAS